MNPNEQTIEEFRNELLKYKKDDVIICGIFVSICYFVRLLADKQDINDPLRIALDILGIENLPEFIEEAEAFANLAKTHDMGKAIYYVDVLKKLKTYKTS